MPRRCRAWSGLALFLALAGCAVASRPVGRDYAQSVFATFRLGETTVAEAEAALGPPIRQSTISGIAKPTATLVAPGTMLTLNSLSYYYAPGGLGQPSGRHPSKFATVVFIGDRLVEYTIGNAIPSEIMPPVDEARLGELHQGRTTRDQAIALFGMPIHQVLHRYDQQNGNSEIGYGWSHVAGGTVTSRTLRIFFDRTGVMSSYAVLDNSFPANSAPMLQFGPQAPGQGAPGVPPPSRPRPPVDREHT